MTSGALAFHCSSSYCGFYIIFSAQTGVGQTAVHLFPTLLTIYGVTALPIKGSS